MIRITLNGEEVKPGQGIETLAVERERAFSKDRSSRERFDPLVCQCCGERRTADELPSCVCTGIPWYQSADGRVECQAHKWARAINPQNTTFDLGGAR